MDTGKIQFPCYPLEVSYSSNQLETETDSRGYLSDSPPFSPSCHLNLLRLSSESDDCLEIHSPICPSLLGLAVTDDNPCKKDKQVQEYQGKVSFESRSELRGKFLFEMESTNGKEMAIKSSQDSERSKIYRGDSLNPHSKDSIPSNFNQSAEQLTSEERNKCKDPRAPRRDVKEQKDSGSAATREDTVSSHFLIPSGSSQLDLRRKLKRRASRDPLPAESRGRNEIVSCSTTPKSPRKSPAPTTRKTNHSTQATKRPRSVMIKEKHIKYHKDPRVPLPSTRKARVGSVSTMEGPEQEKPSLTDRQTGISTSEKYKEIFEERNRKATVPFLPEIRQPNRSSCPVFQNSHWKSPKKSPVFVARNSGQLTYAPHSPRFPKVKHSCFVYPEALSVPRTSTRKTRLGSPRRTSKGQEWKISKSKDDQKETKTLQEKQRETCHLRQQSAPSLPIIRQPRHQCQSRDQMGSAVCTSAESYTEAPQRRRPSSRPQVARHTSSLLLEIPDEKTSTGDTNALASNSTSQLALRRENSDHLPAISRQEGSKSKEHFKQVPRLLIRRQ